MKIEHKFGDSKHKKKKKRIQKRIVEEKEETMASEQAKWEAETCPVHGHGNCHFGCCGECSSTGITYKQDWSKYEKTLKIVKYEERFVVCPLCGKEIVVSKKIAS